MAKADLVDHNLALVRAATAPPRAAKARVRAALAPLPAAGRAASGPAPWRAAWKGLGLLGVGLVAGYWLGAGRVGMPTNAGVPSATALPVSSTDEQLRSRAAGSSDVENPASSPPGRPHTERQTVPDLGSGANDSADADARASAPGPRANAAAQSQRARRNGAGVSNAPPRAISPSQSTSVAELMLLSRAERAIRAGDGRLALAFITELEQGHPRTRFGEERQALRVLAECLLREPRAQARATNFREARPTSVYSDRIERLCLGEGTPASGAGADGSAEGAH